MRSADRLQALIQRVHKVHLVPVQASQAMRLASTLAEASPNPLTIERMVAQDPAMVSLVLAEAAKMGVQDSVSLDSALRMLGKARLRAIALGAWNQALAHSGGPRSAFNPHRYLQASQSTGLLASGLVSLATMRGDCPTCGPELAYIGGLFAQLPLVLVAQAGPCDFDSTYYAAREAEAELETGFSLSYGEPIEILTDAVLAAAQLPANLRFAIDRRMSAVLGPNRVAAAAITLALSLLYRTGRALAPWPVERPLPCAELGVLGLSAEDALGLLPHQPSSEPKEGTTLA